MYELSQTSPLKLQREAVEAYNRMAGLFNKLKKFDLAIASAQEAIEREKAVLGAKSI